MGTFTPKLFSLIKCGYSYSDCWADFLAGLTVAIVALPLAIALAIASGSSPEKGLITAIVAGFLISFFGGSRVQIGGPTGAFVVVVYTVISQHGFAGLIVATLLAGIILLIAGYARLGQLIKFIPHPVVIGFTCGIAIIIASSQITDFLGLNLSNLPADFIAKWHLILIHIDEYDISTIGIGILSLGIIVFFRWFSPKFPGYLIAVGSSAVLVGIMHIPVTTIGSRFPILPNGLPIPHLPLLQFSMIKSVIPAAFIIAFLAGIEALLSAVVADGMTGYKHRSNQELVGQGIANIASALFGGLPATGAIARTAINTKAGGKTPMAGIFHAIFILLFMIFATPMFKFIPMATLAAILFVVAWEMSERNHFFHILRLPHSDRLVMVLTFLLTVFVDLTVGIGVGVILACLLFMKHMSDTLEIKSKRNAVGVDCETDKRTSSVEVLQINGPIFFSVAGELIDTIKLMAPMPKTLIIRMALVPYLDATGERVIETIIRQCYHHRTHVILTEIQSQPMEMISQSSHLKDISNLSICPDYETAMNQLATVNRSPERG